MLAGENKYTTSPLSRPAQRKNIANTLIYIILIIIPKLHNRDNYPRISSITNNNPPASEIANNNPRTFNLMLDGQPAYTEQNNFIKIDIFIFQKI